MNIVLKEILESGTVSNGDEVIPLNSHMDESEGSLLETVVQSVRPTTSLEVGFAYGLSTLYICESLEKLNCNTRHIALDPFQFSLWKGVGLRNIERAGYLKFLNLREEKSEIGLPKLLAENTVLDLALIDGWHTFDHALVDFFYINKMLRVGGVVVLDDASWPSIGKLVDHILTYGCYRVFATPRRPLSFLGPRLFLALKRLAYYLGLRKSKWPSAVALEKFSPDDRSWNWHCAF